MMPLRRKLKREGGLRGKNFDDKRREEFEKEANLPLTMEDFTEALKNAKPSVGKADMANF